MKPDEAFIYGPILVERYGRYVRLANTSTPKQHAAFLARSKEANRKIREDLERDVLELQNIISQYDPVELMHRAAYVLLPLFIKYRSENEFTSDESIYLPTVEYLQYLIARTKSVVTSDALTEDKWETLWSKAIAVMRLTQSYVRTRGTSSNPPSQLDDLRFMIDSRRLMIRVRRYPLFLAEYLRTSLTPYERQIQEIYGTDVDALIDSLLELEEYFRTGVGNRYNNVRTQSERLSGKLLDGGYSVDPDATPEDVERTRAALETEEYRALYDEVRETMRLALTPAIFDITDLTSLPRSLLSLLAVKPGESVLTTLSGPNHDDLSPLSTSVLHKKPFLEVDGRFYSFYHSGFEDSIPEIIETALFQDRPGQVSEMAKRRSDRIESDATKLLTAIVPPDFVFPNVYYPNPDDPSNLTELDVLYGIDDILFLMEVKAGTFSISASRGAPKSLAQDLSELIVEGQRQSERAERYIKSSDEVPFFDSRGKREVCRIKQSRFRKILRVVITREDLGWVGARIAVLSVLDRTLSQSYPWHVSIDDLRIIADLFRGDEIRFIHYLELRLLAASETALTQHDEIEHISLYNKINFYHEPPVMGLGRMTYDPSYMRDIDYYFMGKRAGESPKVPTQDMPPKMRVFIDALRESHLAGRFEVGSIVLNMDSSSRNDFRETLNTLDAGLSERKQRTARMAFTEQGCGLSITYADGPRFEEELRRSAVQMEQACCKRWLVVQLSDKAPCRISKIEVIAPGRFAAADLTGARAHHEKTTRRRIETTRPGRNDPCPCGSGKKFKRCHGFSN